ncbi:LTA synthase family protein [Clostridium paraputrificum]|uniref:LTA synthase family protein n=1 Tax=Clostridium TaxID=1485 RepID=UPI003D325760
MKKRNVKSSMINFYRGLVDLKNKTLNRPISKFRFTIVLDMLVKTVLFLTLLEVNTADKIKFSNISVKFIFVYLAFILVLYSFGYLFSKNRQIIFYIILNILYSGLMIADLWYFRVNRDFFGLKNIFFNGTFNPVGESLLNFKPIDLLFVIDIVIIIVLVLAKKIKNEEKREVSKFSFTIRYSIIMVLVSFIFLDVLSLGGWDKRILKKGWTTLMSVRGPGPLGYHAVEAGRTINKVIKNTSKSDIKEIEEWLDYNKENIEPNEYEGIAKGKNVILLQIESLENFIINREVNGKEISPFLNKLTREGLYFNNIYEQNNAGNSIDCDFMVNTSVYPLGDKITALNYGENVFKNSLPRILNESGYTTISTHAEDIGEFNWTELHKNSFGAQELWDIGDYVYDETVGYGLSDRSFFTQISNKLKDVKKPFLIQAPTLSSHGPFAIDEKYRGLDLPKEIDESYLGGYFESVRYTDQQVEMFFNQLEEAGLLDNSLIVLYGDHGGVHKYYNEEIQELDYEGNWWKEYDHKIPLMIYSKDIKPKVIEASGGQVDILPTVSYLLGVESELYKNTSMGRVLVNTNRDATIIKGNEIKGNVKDNTEKEHLLKAYEIGSKIIKNDYFSDR